MASFGGTTQKCMACDKTVYLVDKLTADGRIYHKACFRCHHCRNTLKLSNYCSFEGVLYCRPHYDQLYKRTGSLDKSFQGTPKIQTPERQITGNEVISLQLFLPCIILSKLSYGFWFFFPYISIVESVSTLFCLLASKYESFLLPSLPFPLISMVTFFFYKWFWWLITSVNLNWNWILLTECKGTSKRVLGHQRQMCGL